MRHGVLDESRYVGGCLGKDFFKTLPIVVIADQQIARHFKVREDVPHRKIGWLRPVIGEISRQDHELGIAVDPVDHFDNMGEPVAWMHRAQHVGRWDEVRTGDVDEFHDPARLSCQAI